MSRRPGTDRVQAERIIALCRAVDAAIKAAADQRASTTRAFAALVDAQRKTMQLCEEADQLLKDTETSEVPRAVDRRRRARSGR